MTILKSSPTGFALAPPAAALDPPPADGFLDESSPQPRKIKGARQHKASLINVSRRITEPSGKRKDRRTNQNTAAYRQRQLIAVGQVSNLSGTKGENGVNV